MFKILVVEDDRELNKTVCSFLNHSGYEAVGCLGANEAYDAMYENVFDMIMPYFDSYNNYFSYSLSYTNYIINFIFISKKINLSVLNKQKDYTC